MTCSDVVARLDDFLDGELSAEAARRVRDHLADCAACRREHDLAVQVRGLLGSAAAPDPGDEYFAESESHILARTVLAGDPEAVRRGGGEGAAPRSSTALLRALVSVAASLAILFAAIYLGSSRELLISRTIGPEIPVLATAEVRSELGDSPVFTREDRARITRGMMLIGGPGILGRFTALPQIVKTNPLDES